RNTMFSRDWSSDVCSSDLKQPEKTERLLAVNQRDDAGAPHAPQLLRHGQPLLHGAPALVGREHPAQDEEEPKQVEYGQRVHSLCRRPRPGCGSNFSASSSRATAAARYAVLPPGSRNGLVSTTSKATMSARPAAMVKMTITSR